MTMPPEDITVECPSCQNTFQDWYRPSINLSLDNFDEDYIKEATNANCPKCGATIELDVLIVDSDKIWRAK